MTEYVIETQSLYKVFGNKLALSNLNLNIPRGGTHAIVGANGAGKSTLFRLLLGLMTPTQGSCRVLGENSLQLTPATRGRVAYVNEEHTLPAWMRAQQVTQMQRDLHPRWKQDVYHEVLCNFDVRPAQLVGGLSRGERAGLNLAMALAQSPELLILDEPTLGLDVVAKQAFLESLMFIGAKSESTIIYCSHHMEEVERVCDNLIILERGHLHNNSTPEQFCARIKMWTAQFPTPPSREQIPGLLSMRNFEDLQQLLVIDQGLNTQSVLHNLGASSISHCSVSLDKAVNAFLAKNHLSASISNAA